MNCHVVYFWNANNISFARGTRKDIPKKKSSKTDNKLAQDLPETDTKAKGLDRSHKQNQSLSCLGANGSVRWSSVESFVPRASGHLLSTHRPSHWETLITACHYVGLHLSLSPWNTVHSAKNTSIQRESRVNWINGKWIPTPTLQLQLFFLFVFFSFFHKPGKDKCRLTRQKVFHKVNHSPWRPF